MASRFGRGSRELDGLGRWVATTQGGPFSRIPTFVD